MGSVIDYIECPRCKSENMYEEFYYKTHESNAFCDQCGYSRRNFYKRDEEGKVITIDGKTPTFENVIMEEIVHEEPYGAIRIEFENKSFAQAGTIQFKKDLEQMIEMSSNQQEMDLLDIKSVKFSRFNEVSGKIEKELIYLKK